ncbi:DUF6053 domain-containing protein [Lysobacter gummosus]|uniref:DUF6053 domain-containing protein n=1 Tax=Lysobacter gummosus TaxID=262324 RepID=UPI00363CCC43
MLFNQAAAICDKSIGAEAPPTKDLEAADPPCPPAPAAQRRSAPRGPIDTSI